MRQWQPLGGALGHGADSAARLGRRRGMVRRRTDSQEWHVRAAGLEAAQSRQSEVASSGARTFLSAASPEYEEGSDWFLASAKHIAADRNVRAPAVPTSLPSAPPGTVSWPARGLCSSCRVPPAGGRDRKSV